MFRSVQQPLVGRAQEARHKERLRRRLAKLRRAEYQYLEDDIKKIEEQKDWEKDI